MPVYFRVEAPSSRFAVSVMFARLSTTSRPDVHKSRPEMPEGSARWTSPPVPTAQPTLALKDPAPVTLPEKERRAPAGHAALSAPVYVTSLAMACEPDAAETYAISCEPVSIVSALPPSA